MHFDFLLPPMVWRAGLLTLAALIAGFINSIAGGGSLIAFPALLKAGLLPIQANATNTVALWPGHVTSIAGYREELRRHLNIAIPVVIVSLIGSLAGAWVLLNNSQDSFLRLVPYLFLLGSISFAVSKPLSRAVRRRLERKPGGGRVLLLPLLVALLCICFYIGYFGAGAGLMIMTALALFGIEHIAEINAFKVIITTMANGVACIAFIARAAVAWHDCWYMMIACALGGYIGARNSRRVSDRVLRPIIVTYGLSLAVYFFVRHGHI